ncbi:MAG: IS1634 family transposase [Caldisericia bacterium]|nr:IS1634 family transposase [Caldisericia bacterium]
MKTTTTRGVKEYIQLCHSYRDTTGRSRTEVIYNLGRSDQVDPAAIRRLMQSLSKLLPEEESGLFSVDKATPDFVYAKSLGGTWLLDQLWHRLGIDQTLLKLIQKRKYQPAIERHILAMIANRALDPSSKLNVEHWIQEVYLKDLPEVEVHQLYRAMDFLLEASEEIQKEVFFSVANLFNLEVDLLFLDTTTTYFEIEGEDADKGEAEEVSAEEVSAEEVSAEATQYTELENHDRNTDDDLPEKDKSVADASFLTIHPGLRKRGHSKDSHPELAQVVIAFAVTRDGIPVRCWVWPGNTSDQEVVQEVKQDLNRWKLGRVIMVQDTGFNSDQNRRTLQQAGGHYIIGEKLRLGPKGGAHEALQQRGKFKTITIQTPLKDHYTNINTGHNAADEEGNENEYAGLSSHANAYELEVKEVVIGGDSCARRRFVLIRNPEEATRDRKKREDILQETERRLALLNQLSGTPHQKAACALRSHKTYGRYIRQSKTGKLFIHQAKIRSEAQFDGKYLISTSDDSVSVEDLVLGYKQLFVIERVFRDLKHLVDIRPVYHHLPDRIRAHVLLCWLAMLMIRVTENETQCSWFQLKKILSSLQVATLNLPSQGQIQQSNPLTLEQREVFEKLHLEKPPRIIRIKP